MSCGCEGKPIQDGKRITGITINNPPEVILFRKVVLPATLGDESAVPPAIGKYKNVLLVYEVNDHAYLYSTDGIPTRIDGGKAYDALAARIERLEAEVGALKNKENA